MDIASDTELLSRLRSGDSSGLSQLYTRYYERLLRYCSSLIGDRQKAEDLVQDVFVKLHSKQDTIKDGQSLQCWLFTVARNAAYSGLVKQRAATIDESLESDEDAPDELMMAAEQTMLVDAALHSIPFPYREAIMLRVYEQMSYEEIAGITGTSLSAVKSRLFKARKAMLSKLKLRL